jgi:threonine synthase
MARGRSWWLRCHGCGRRAESFGYVCPACGAPLVAELAEPTDPGPAGGPGLWRRAALLPHTDHRVSLGEADTPTVPLPGEWLSGGPGTGTLVAKLEMLNPTLSFKDRAMALAASYALDRGVRGLAVASTGNAAVSASAYAAAAGLECAVVVGTGSHADAKIAACRRLGARVEVVDGDYSAAYAHAAAMESDDWMNVSTTYRNPLLAEAYRTIAAELLDELGVVPGAVVVAIGAGPLLWGIQRGFEDVRRLAGGDRLPALVGVQAARVAPIARRWAARYGGRVPDDGDGATVATAIADPLRGYEVHAELTIEAVERGGGTVLAVTEAQIAQAEALLVGHGLWTEVSSAVAVAAVRHHPIPGADRGPVVVVLTGHGAKDARA